MFLQINLPDPCSGPTLSDHQILLTFSLIEQRISLKRKDIIKVLEFVRIILQFILIESFQFLQCSESRLILENAIVFATSDEESLIFVNAIFS